MTQQITRNHLSNQDAFPVEGLILCLVLLAAWVTHTIVCIKTSAWVLLGIGYFLLPVGVIHGIGVWLGTF